MFPSVVTECTPRALTFCLAFINLFLVNSLVGRVPYSVYDLFPGCCCLLFDLSRRFLCCLVSLFFFGCILWFLRCCRCLLGGFSFLGYHTEGVSFELSSFLEIFFVFDCFAKSFPPFPLIDVFLLNGHTSNCFFRDFVFHYFSECYPSNLCSIVLTFDLL